MFEIPKETNTGRIEAVTIGATPEKGGTRSHTITIGGSSALPFLDFEGEFPHAPVVAMEVFDTPPKKWPEELRIIGDYRFAWGTEWNGFLVLETDNPELFFNFWPRFRNKTRWYVDNTKTVIGLKRYPAEWLQEQ